MSSMRKLAQMARRSDASLGEMTYLGLVQQFLRPLLGELAETDLDRFIAVGRTGLSTMVTVQGPASTTVTGTRRPSETKTCVMPIFLPRIAFFIITPLSIVTQTAWQFAR